MIVNTSSESLTVTAESGDSVPVMTEDVASESADPVNVSVRAAVQGRCVLPTSAACTLPPSGRLLVNSAGPLTWSVAVDPLQTAVATVAGAAAAYVKSKLQTPVAEFRDRITGCAQSVDQFATDHNLEDLVRNAYATQGCIDLIDDIRNNPGAAPPSEGDTKAVIREAGAATKDLRNDFSVFALTELLTHLRR